MPKPNNRGRTRRSGLLIVGISTLVLVGAAATLLFVVGWTKIRGVFAHEKVESHEGKVAVVVSPVFIPAFTAIDPALFLDPRTGDFHVAWVPEKIVTEKGLVRDPGPMRGRVLRNDKAPGLTLSEADFYPKGTSASLTAAIEPGYRGVTLDGQKVNGLESLKRFDRFDLVAVIDVKATTAAKDSGIVMTPEAEAARDSERQWKTDRRTIVQNGMVIKPLPKSRTGGQDYDCFVGIRDEESAALNDALAKGVKIICQARSGLPGGDLAPAYKPSETPTVDSINVISGDKSWKSLVPAGKSEDTSGTTDAEPKK